MADDITVDGSTVAVGDTTIVLQDGGGAPLALETRSSGAVTYILPSGDRVTLRFLEAGGDG